MFASTTKKHRLGLTLAILMFLGIFVSLVFFIYQQCNRTLNLQAYRDKLNAITEHREIDTTVVYAASGEVIATFFDRFQIHRSFDEIPKALVDAVIATEDRNFYTHDGIDRKAILRAMISQVSSGIYQQGGSTITQQLVRQFILSREKSILRKLREVFLARELEAIISKNQILELYLNNMFLGSGAYGVEAAAKRYFSKELANLDLAECALIAGLFQSPNHLNPLKYPHRAKTRQKIVLNAMYKNRMITKDELVSAWNHPLAYATPTSSSPDTVVHAPYFADYVREQAQKILGQGVNSRGLKIITTLDLPLQKAAEAAIARSSNALDEIAEKEVSVHRGVRPTIEAALLATNPTTGAIVSMVGGRSHAKSQFNRTTQATRSPGSAFKPIVYALALEQGHRWSDVLYVDPIRVQDYTPKNMGNEYLTETTLLRAFYKSLNTPAVELGEKLGIQNVIQMAKKMGVYSPLKVEAGTVLGSSEVTMMDMARVYATIANKGLSNESFAIEKIEDKRGNTLYTHTQPAPKVALSAEASYLMTEGLRAVLDRGTGARSASLSSFAAGKTGTSNQSEDNWFCGFTSNLVSIAWVGSDNHSAISGRAAANTLALPIWDRFITDAQNLRPSELFVSPEHIVSLKIHPEFGHQDEQRGITMYFREDNQPTKKYSALKDLRETGGYRDIFSP